MEYILIQSGDVFRLERAQCRQFAVVPLTSPRQRARPAETAFAINCGRANERAGFREVDFKWECTLFLKTLPSCQNSLGVPLTVFARPADRVGRILHVFRRFEILHFGRDLAARVDIGVHRPGCVSRTQGEAGPVPYKVRALLRDKGACDTPHYRRLSSPMDTRDSGRITGVLLASWVGIEYLMEEEMG
ncbi:hypothetical protein EVAR_66504_1 [Eumeta japonica]|uniref:Uncharacterized protein n=1 Tax=Eumeta variegata TaxID=151549 RepID=A0A4C1ZA01_EUMVA|nr:hypothetical protein EVAR_66504_1 [Eumeta japonica]